MRARGLRAVGQQPERVLVVDRGAAFAEALVRLLDGAGMDATAASFGNAQRQAGRAQPSLLLLDGDADRDEVVALAAAVRAAAPEVRVLLLVRRLEQADELLVRRAQAVGRVLRGAGADVLVRAIDRIRLGRPLRHVGGPTSSSRARASTEGRLLRELTRRELEVLRAMMNGLGGPAIADLMGISPNTVRTHVQHILTKLGAHNRLEAAGIALRGGLLPFGEALPERARPRSLVG